MSCPLCFSKKIKKKFTLAPPYSLIVCENCDFQFLDPLPADEHIQEIYDQGNYYEKSCPAKDRMEREALERIQRINFLLPRKGSLLEIGCAAGIFLGRAIDAGWKVSAVETSLHLSQYTEKKYTLGERMIRGRFELLDIQKKFDVICFWEVIEHVKDPRAFLAKAQTLLAPGGLICFSTPNMDSVVAYCMKEKFPMLIPPEHISYFSQKSLRTLLTSQNLIVRYATTFSNLGRNEVMNGLARRGGIPPFLIRFGTLLGLPLISLGMWCVDHLFHAGIEFEIYAAAPGQ